MRIYILDILRFFAAFWIVLYHYTFFGYLCNKMTVLNLQELGYFFKYGFLGVELFFMISGFVILMSLENKNIVSFVKSRFLRLYPTFFISMSLTSLVVFYFGGMRYTVTLTEYIINLSMISDIFHVKYIDGVYWTLLFELKFYFIILLLLFFQQIKNIRIYLSIWLTISYINYFSPLPKIMNFFLMPEYAGYFIVGALFYLSYQSKFQLKDLILIFLTYIINNLYLIEYIKFLREFLQTDFSSLFIIVILTVFYIIFAILGSKYFLFNRRSKSIIFILGAMTYPLYLIHENIGFIIFNHFFETLNKYILLSLVLALMLFLAYIIYFLDKKILKILKYK